ncbi:MAG: alpha/beta hydrolase [Flavisolibacter sp.]|nr:alpha/beta hydrolase [Flavisolibacter sp.]
MCSIQKQFIFFLLIFPLSFSRTLAQSDTAHLFRSFDNTTIYYEVHGKGFPIVLIHGFMSDGQSWKRTVLYNQLLQEGFQVIVPDLRGNGRSDKLQTADAYANDAEAKDVMLLMKSLGLKRYDVVGYSRGAIITARLLVLDKRVQKAVMGGMGADFTNPQWPRRIAFYHALIADTVPELHNMVKRVQDAGLDQVALAYQQKEQPSTPKEALQKVTKPVLVICGKEDNDNGSAQELVQLFPKGHYAAVPGNHGAAVRTKEFGASVTAFLKNNKELRKP